MTDEPKGPASSSPDEESPVGDRAFCAQCKHHQRFHGKGVCDACSGFTGDNHHAFAPAAGETAGEPEAPEPWPCGDCGAMVPGGQDWCQDPGCKARAQRRTAAYDAALIRPPIALTYVTGDGGRIEIALPGDATVGVHENALIVCHPSGVLGIQQVKPYEEGP